MDLTLAAGSCQVTPEKSQLIQKKQTKKITNIKRDVTGGNLNHQIKLRGYANCDPSTNQYRVTFSMEKGSSTFFLGSF